MLRVDGTEHPNVGGWNHINPKTGCHTGCHLLIYSETARSMGWKPPPSGKSSRESGDVLPPAFSSLASGFSRSMSMAAFPGAWGV